MDNIKNNVKYLSNFYIFEKKLGRIEGKEFVPYLSFNKKNDILLVILLNKLNIQHLFMLVLNLFDEFEKPKIKIKSRKGIWDVNNIEIHLSDTNFIHKFIYNKKSIYIFFDTLYILTTRLNNGDNGQKIDKFIEEYIKQRDLFDLIISYDDIFNGFVNVEEYGIVIQGKIHKYFLTWNNKNYVLFDDKYPRQICLITDAKNNYETSKYIKKENMISNIKNFGLDVKWNDLILLSKIYFLLNDYENIKKDNVFNEQISF